MKYGLIGCGRIAKKHLRAAKVNQLEITAICDICPEKMKKILLETGIRSDAVRQYTDYYSMLVNEKLDLISIATESGSHAEIALSVIEKGIHVIIEKPIALNIADADAIVQKGIENNVVVSVCHQNRFNIAVQKMRAALEDGRFGKISHGSLAVRWNRSRDYYAQADWRGTWKEDGGALMNQCIHGIDLLCWMMNSRPVSVCGFIRRRLHDYIEAEDIGVGIISFENGSVAAVEGTTNMYSHNLEETLCLSGEFGTVKIGGVAANDIEVWDFHTLNEADEQNRKYHEIVKDVYGNGHDILFQDVKTAIEQSTLPYVTALDGRNSLEIILAIYQSQKTGKIVQLPLRSFSTMEMRHIF